MAMKVVPLAPAISNTNGPDCFMWAIPSYSKNGKQAMQMLNLMYSDKDLFNLLNWGIEGKHYVKTADGLIDFPQGVNSSNSGYPVFSSFMWGNQLLSYVFKGDSPKLYDEYAELNKTAIKSKGLGFIYDAGSKKTENAACLNVWQQYDKSLGVGAVDPNKVLPVFINKLKAAGVDKIIADKQQQFDEWLKTNGTK
jgi:putative aldouronate transport system substrate-binding protein